MKISDRFKQLRNAPMRQTGSNGWIGSDVRLRDTKHNHHLKVIEAHIIKLEVTQRSMTDNPTVKEILIDIFQTADEINESQSVIDMIWDYLENNDFDGLCSEQCGCIFTELAPMSDCSGSIRECRVGYKNPCVFIKDECGCDCGENEHEWCMRLTKPEATDENTKT